MVVPAPPPLLPPLLPTPLVKTPKECYKPNLICDLPAIQNPVAQLGEFRSFYDGLTSALCHGVNLSVTISCMSVISRRLVQTVITCRLNIDSCQSRVTARERRNAAGKWDIFYQNLNCYLTEKGNGKKWMCHSLLMMQRAAEFKKTMR